MLTGELRYIILILNIRIKTENINHMEKNSRLNGIINQLVQPELQKFQVIHLKAGMKDNGIMEM